MQFLKVKESTGIKVTEPHHIVQLMESVASIDMPAQVAGGMGTTKEQLDDVLREIRAHYEEAEIDTP